MTRIKTSDALKLIMTTFLETSTYTPEAYLELEIKAEERNEYRNGEIIPMTGGTPNHNRISGNLYIALSLLLRNQPYAVFHADQRLWIPDRTLYTYPDVMVIPKPIQLQTGRNDTVTNPCFIAEALSKSTQNYDRGDKFSAYRTLESFQEYLLIDQYRYSVEHYLKTGDRQWLLSEYNDPTATIDLSTLALRITLGDLYEEVEWEDS